MAKLVPADAEPAKAKLTQSDVTKDEADAYYRAVFEDAMNRGWGSGVPSFVHELGGKATDLASTAGLPPEVSAGVGAGANFAANAIPAFLTSGKFAVAPVAPVLAGPAKRILQSAVKPGAADIRSKAADRALGTMLEENIYPTAGGMEKTSRIAGELEKQVQDAIAASPENVSVAAIGSRLRGLYEKAMRQVNPQADLAAIRASWDEFVKSPLIKGKTEIPVQLAQDLKKGTYRSLAGKYGEIGSTSTEAQKALARGAREEVASKVPEVTELLKREAALMNVKDVAATRALQSGNNNLLGLAALRLDHPLSAISFWADRWPALKAFLAMQLYGGSKPQLLAPLGIESGILQSQPERGVLSER